MTKHVTLALTDAQAAHFSELAARQEVPLETVLEHALDRQVDYDAWVQVGLDAIERGDTLTHEEVVRRAEDRAARLMRKT